MSPSLCRNRVSADAHQTSRRSQGLTPRGSPASCRAGTRKESKGNRATNSGGRSPVQPLLTSRFSRQGLVIARSLIYQDVYGETCGAPTSPQQPGRIRPSMKLSFHPFATQRTVRHRYRQLANSMSLIRTQPRTALCPCLLLDIASTTTVCSRRTSIYYGLLAKGAIKESKAHRGRRT